jgi:Zn-dependent protease with chaperone function
VATDFFDRQDAARRNTTRLVVLFVLAVVAIMVSIHVLLAVALGYLGAHPAGGAERSLLTDPAIAAVAFVGTLIVVGGGSLFKVAQLRGGGRVVAEQLDGRLVSPDTTDPAERQLMNVVEEMAIAAGMPAPPVYLMEREAGINAFAAGFAPGEAVIGVSRGAAEQLSRDELQGVIAHEFSHILNGDMRLNIRLIGLLHGILIVGMLGYFVLRMTAFSGHRGRRSRDQGNAMLPILAIGLGLMIVGFFGTFFGNLIKAAVSRQREFLADAAAVQFTRQPDGIAGALKKIGGLPAGSTIQNPNAPEASHMFFGRATSGFSAMFSTHPPLRERIRRIDPSWDGTFPEVATGAERGRLGLPRPPALLRPEVLQPGPRRQRRTPSITWASPPRRTSSTPRGCSTASRNAFGPPRTNRTGHVRWCTRCCSIATPTCARRNCSTWSAPPTLACSTRRSRSFRWSRNSERTRGSRSWRSRSRRCAG